MAILGIGHHIRFMQPCALQRQGRLQAPVVIDNPSQRTLSAQNPPGAHVARADQSILEQVVGLDVRPAGDEYRRIDRHRIAPQQHSRPKVHVREPVGHEPAVLGGIEIQPARPHGPRIAQIEESPLIRIPPVHRDTGRHGIRGLVLLAFLTFLGLFDFLSILDTDPVLGSGCGTRACRLLRASAARAAPWPRRTAPPRRPSARPEPLRGPRLPRARALRPGHCARPGKRHPAATRPGAPASLHSRASWLSSR
jgi:hypothetical protein